MKSKLNHTEIIKVAEIANKVDAAGKEYFDRESDVMFQLQPLMLSLLIGYQADLKSEQLNGMMLLLFIVWEYFKDKPAVKRQKITEDIYEEIMKRDIQMFRYLEGADQREASEIAASELKHIQSKELLAAVQGRLIEGSEFRGLDQQTRIILFIGMKGLVECFERLG